jgi:hypothetical protein
VVVAVWTDHLAAGSRCLTALIKRTGEAVLKAATDRARAARFVPQVERLEGREMLAATASLNAGVLNVNGSSASDTIILRQSGGRVKIDGLSKSFATSNIQSVVINSGGGADTVSLVGLKAQPWNKPITVRNSGGLDTVKLLTGQNCFLSGGNQTLNLSGSGMPTLNGQALDWFDYAIRDAALKDLLRSEYGDDSVLDRGEMLVAFDQVETDGTVSGHEFNDLKAVANNAWLFGSFTYVTDLTRSVVLSNRANAKFQGTTLGNLTGGSSAAKLDKLVGKWFLGEDRPNASYPGVHVTYVHAAGSLFGQSGPQYTDVRQGAVGDCYFVGVLAEIAQESPATITSMFIANGDETYTVRFFQNGTPRYVTVDSLLPTYGGGWLLYAGMGSHASNPSNVLWVALAEKAYAQMNEAGWLRPASWGGGQNSYFGIEGGLFTDVTRQVANRFGVNHSVMGNSDAAAIHSAVTSGKLIGFASRGAPADSRIVGNHQYILVGYNHTTKTVTLFNPWGINNGSEHPGLVTLTLGQLGSSFDYWSVA